MLLERTLQSPLDCKEVQPVNPKGNQPWIFTGRTDAETPIHWPPDVKNWLTGKDPDAGKEWRQEEKGTRGWDGWMAPLTQWTWVWASSGRWWWTGKAWHVAVHGVAKGQTWLSDWTQLNWTTNVPGKSHERKSVVGYSPWDRKESDMTEQPHFHFYQHSKHFHWDKGVNKR